MQGKSFLNISNSLIDAKGLCGWAGRTGAITDCIIGGESLANGTSPFSETSFNGLKDAQERL